jgi:hypothetical protein
MSVGVRRSRVLQREAHRLVDREVRREMESLDRDSCIFRSAASSLRVELTKTRSR